MNEKNIKKILDIILTNIKNEDILWRLEGSANLKIQNINVSVNDLDITTNKQGLELFKKKLNKFITKSFFNKKINGETLNLEINGFEIEINTYKDEELNMFNKIKKINLENLIIPILPLKDSKKFYELIKCKEKVELISKYLNK